MANKNKAVGTDEENRVLEMLEGQGWRAIRNSPGAPFDIVAISPTGQVVHIQNKKTAVWKVWEWAKTYSDYAKTSVKKGESWCIWMSARDRRLTTSPPSGVWITEEEYLLLLSYRESIRGGK